MMLFEFASSLLLFVVRVKVEVRRLVSTESVAIQSFTRCSVVRRSVDIRGIY